MTEQELERRGEDARQLLENELFREAWSLAREKLVSRIEREPLTDPELLRVCMELRGLFRTRVHVEQIVVTGTMAAQDIERKRSIADRIFRRA